MKRILVFAAVAAAGLVVALPAGAQPPGGGDYGRGDRGDRGGRGFGDPSQFFERLSGGKNVIVIDQLDERMKGMAQRMAAAAGITNGQITREQFNSAMEAFRAQRGMGRGGFGGPPGGGAPGGPPSGGDSQNGQGGPGRGGQMTPEQMDRMAEDNFRRHDKNNTGQLEFDEMPDNLKSNLAKYDTNKDGIISLDEYKPYFRDRMEARNAERAQSASENGQSANAEGLPPAPESGPVQEEEKKATVYRTGKMPKELPAWFVDMDIDKDGQVGLWEWVRVRGSGSESIELFRTMDRNDDGLLTVDEVLSYARLNSKSTGDTAVASITSGDDRSRGAAVAEVTITGGGQEGGRRFRGGPGGWGGGPPGWGNSPGGNGDGSTGMQGPRRGGFGGGPGGGGGFDRRNRGDSGRDNSGSDGSRKGRGRGGFDRGGPNDAGRDNATDGSKDKNKP
jgi:Ca2+-binding EF-hand superfamily protein